MNLKNAWLAFALGIQSTILSPCILTVSPTAEFVLPLSEY